MAKSSPAQYVFEFYRELPVRPDRPERLFFGLLPDPEAGRRIARFGQDFLRTHHLAHRLIRTDRLHVSLYHVGDYRRLRTTLLYAATQAAQAVAMPPFEVTFRSAMSFESLSSRRPDRHPLVLLGESDALLEFHRRLGDAIRTSGLRAAEVFTPHMTLSYDPRRVAAQAIDPIGFMVKDLYLIHSKLWLSEYEVIGRWPLRS